MSSFFVISFCFRFVSFLIIRKFALSGQSLFTVVMPKMAGIIILGGAKVTKYYKITIYLLQKYHFTACFSDICHDLR